MKSRVVCLIVYYRVWSPLIAAEKCKETWQSLLAFSLSSTVLHCGFLATFLWANCFCDPWNVRGNASFSLAVPWVWRPWPLSSAPVHTPTRRHTRAHAGSLFAKRKAIHCRRGTSSPFYSTNTFPRLPDVTSQQAEIIVRILPATPSFSRLLFV